MQIGNGEILSKFFDLATGDLDSKKVTDIEKSINDIKIENKLLNEYNVKFEKILKSQITDIYIFLKYLKEKLNISQEELDEFGRRFTEEKQTIQKNGSDGKQV